ncbi:ABC transporter A family member 5-like [Lycorma delicatula]|uniref:ABC transporter A family member 5-like n=1 Tax=Lycorma delicatula TaxID=130591 RepID=UPI003F51757F
MFNTCNILYAVIWKNCKIRRHHLCGTLCEILFPCLIICALLFVHINTDDRSKKRTDFIKETNFSVLTSNDMKNCLLSYPSLLVAYGPETEFTKKIMDKVKTEIGSSKVDDKFISLPHENDVKNLFYYGAQRINYGIVFDTSNPTEKEFKYQILHRVYLPPGPFPSQLVPGPMLRNMSQLE